MAIRDGAARRRPSPWAASALAAVAVCLAVPVIDGAPQQGATTTPRPGPDDPFLEDLSKRAFLFFWEQTDPATGIIRDRSRTDGSASSDNHVKVGSIASVGFGLTGMCIAAERGWQPRSAILERTRTTLRTFAEKLEHQHGWFYHWLNVHTGAREWKSEVSSIDTALLLGGVLSVRQCFAADPEISKLATAIYHRVDFGWMRNGHPTLLSHGWRPESGMIVHRWDAFSEASMLYLLGIGSPTHPLPAASWRAWVRPTLTWDGTTYVTHAGPLFLHQYSHAWVDFRAWRDPDPPHDWFANSRTATLANQRYCVSLRDRFPGYSETLWGVTASDARSGYKAWGGPPHDPQVDGTVVPCAAAGSLMFDPGATLPALRHMQERFGDRLYGRYGFADAFHPTADWINPDVIGIDQGITLLSAENARTGNVWRWFMANPEIQTAMRRAGFVPAAGVRRSPPRPASRYELVAAPDAEADRSARATLKDLPAALADRFEPKTFAAPDGVTIAYRLLAPLKAPAAGTPAPLVLVLHGSGEIGADNRAQLTPLALAWARDEARGRDGAYVVVPQMPSRSANYSGPATGDSRTSEGTALVPATLALVDSLLATLPIDRRRIGVVGFSMGASTTWNLLHARPGFFGAAIPIAGVPRADQATSVRPPTRIWVIHGNRDETNPIRHDRHAFVPLADAGATIRFSEIDHLAHDVPPTWLVEGRLADFLLRPPRQ
jgi:poly(3-hydroxybutyrate) depolymerase